jgi:hypothetical protein
MTKIFHLSRRITLILFNKLCYYRSEYYEKETDRMMTRINVKAYFLINNRSIDLYIKLKTTECIRPT